ncbi:MAG: HlyD family secretion protein, partial [Pseudomonadota bacterium]
MTHIAPKKRGLKTAALVLLAVATCGVLAHYGLAYWFGGRFIERTDNAYVRSDIVAVAPRVSGYVVEVAVSDNQAVKAGDLLFRIDPQDYEARLAQSVAGLNAAKATRESLIKERGLQEALVGEAEAALTAAHAEAIRANRDRQRADGLIADGWMTEQRYDTALATETRAQASVMQAEAGLAARRQRLVVLDAEAVRLDAVIEQAAAQVRLATIALEDVTVRAPVAGVVGNRHVEIGHYARTGSPVLAVVPQDVWVVANFRETQLEHIRPGQSV